LAKFGACIRLGGMKEKFESEATKFEPARSYSNATEIRSHRDLAVWQKARQLTVIVFELTRTFPHEERYGLTSQIRRSVVSVAANLAEGHARNSRRDFAHFVGVAKGSLMETETLLVLSVDLGFVREGDTELAFLRITEISKMLTALRKRLCEG
jgi:four helix bundle protein